MKLASSLISNYLKHHLLSNVVSHMSNRQPSDPSVNLAIKVLPFNKFCNFLDCALYDIIFQ